MVIFPYYSHILRESYGSGMGIVWEAYHKGVPLLGVPENPIDIPLISYLFLTRPQLYSTVENKCEVIALPPIILEVENGSIRNDRFLYNRAIFHLHAYGRKGTTLHKRILPFTKGYYPSQSSLANTWEQVSWNFL